jgi:hypothetical protein
MQPNNYEQRTVARGEVAPMCACWHMYSPHYRELLCTLAGIPRLDYLQLIGHPWEYMPPEYRDAVLAVITKTIELKEQKGRAA